MKKVRGSQRVRHIAAVGLCSLSVALVGCTQQPAPNDQQIRQKTADATRDVRQSATQLAADAKVAAAKAVNGVNAVAQGVKDGVNSGKHGETGDLVDINSAATARIAMLPGISIRKAQEIVKGRPYPDAHSLVVKGVLTQSQFDRISGKITATEQ